MKHILLLIVFFTTVFSCTNKYQNIVNSEENYQIIPKPESLEILKGRFLIDSDTKIIGKAELENEGNYLSSMLSDVTGVEISFENSTAFKGNILLELDDSINNAEGYKISVTYNQITILGKTNKGVFYGIQTLRQLIPLSIESDSRTELTIPATLIEDSPRFVYRGMHLDVARHFFLLILLKNISI